MQARFMTAIFLGFVLIGASACGGGGNDEAQLRTDLEAAEEALEQEKEAREKAEQEASDAAAAAEKAAQAAKDAQAAADKAKADAQAEAAKIAAAEEAQEEAEKKAQEAEAARQRLAEERDEAQKALTEAEQAELRARASSFGEELDLGDGTNPGTDTPTDATAGVMASANVSWPRGGSLTFRPAGVTHTAGSAAPGVPGGWRSVSFAGQTGTAASLVDDTIYLYTNIQAPGTRAFWKVHGLTVTMDGTGLAALARGSSATPNADTDDTTDGHQYTTLTVNGSLNGARGKFTCPTACTGTVADGYDTYVTFTQGVPTFSAPGSWTFTPSNIANGYRVDNDDAHLHFGIWSSIPDDITGTYNFRYVAGGGAESGTDLGRFDALTGSATFRGGAVGRYVTQGQVGGQNAKIGTFTATATLNADFGTAAEAGRLSGSITDFKEDGSSLAGWRVTLGSSADVGVASTIAADTGAATGSTVANIGGLSVGGSWSATFHGIDNDGVSELTDPAKYPATKYPPVDLAGVTGWFDAVGSGANDASLAGAFGAACTTGTMCAR